MSAPFLQPEVAQRSHLLAETFTHWTARALTAAKDIPHALYHAPFALVSHGAERDPIFCYANLAAQQLFGIAWEEFVRMPSRLSAEPDAVKERQRLLDEASLKGYVDKYQGVRITKDGRRFRIQDTLLWNVIDRGGNLRGQAAKIDKWEWI